MQGECFTKMQLFCCMIQIVIEGEVGIYRCMYARCAQPTRDIKIEVTKSATILEQPVERH